MGSRFPRTWRPKTKRGDRPTKAEANTGPLLRGKRMALGLTGEDLWLDKDTLLRLPWIEDGTELPWRGWKGIMDGLDQALERYVAAYLGFNGRWQDLRLSPWAPSEIKAAALRAAKRMNHE